MQDLDKELWKLGMRSTLGKMLKRAEENRRKNTKTKPYKEPAHKTAHRVTTTRELNTWRKEYKQ